MTYTDALAYFGFRTIAYGPVEITLTFDDFDNGGSKKSFL